MENKVLNIIEKYNLINNEDKLVVGVSGGPDSIALLNILVNIRENKKMKFDIIVCHVNHLIRQEAIEDENYVIDFCKRNNLECFVKRVKIEEVSLQEKIGTEEAGRNERYKFFNEILEKTNSNKIVTAHTANDNAETVLMNIIRGTSISGLKGIDIKRDNLIRPLLEITRKEIELYCNVNKLEPRIDKTNYENIYTRNKVRNMLIPYIKENFNPNIIEAINRLSSLSNQDNEFIEKIVKNQFEDMLIYENEQEIVLDLKKFNFQDLVIKNRIVLYTINRLLGTKNGIEKKNIEDIIKLCGNNIGNKFLIPDKKIKILVKNKKIFFMPNH